MGAGAAVPPGPSALPDAGLTLLRLPVPVWRVAELHRRVGGHEPGWVLHHAIGDACGTHPPAPFAVVAQDDDHVVVEAYHRGGLEALMAHGLARCRAMGRPERWDGVAWRMAAQQPVFLPAVGARIGFSVRAAAIKRARVGGRVTERPLGPDGWTAWLAANAGGLCIEWPVQAQPEMLRTTRRAQWDQGGRLGPPRPFEVPVLAVSGFAVVEDAGLLERALARGIGRHRSYGLGMLRLHAA